MPITRGCADPASQTRMEPVSRLAAAQRSPRAQRPWRWVCLRSHGTAQNRLLLIAQDSEPGEEGAPVGVGGRRWQWFLLMSERTTHGQAAKSDSFHGFPSGFAE